MVGRKILLLLRINPKTGLSNVMYLLRFRRVHSDNFKSDFHGLI